MFAGTLTDVPADSDLLADPARRAELWRLAPAAAAWTLDDTQAATLELLSNGAYLPLDGFRSPAESAAARIAFTLPDGTPCPEPPVLEVDTADTEPLSAGAPLALRDREGVLLAIVTVGATYPTSGTHVAVVGRVEALELPRHDDHSDLRLTPRQLSSRPEIAGAPRVAALWSAQPAARAVREAARRAADALGAPLVHVVTMAPGRDTDASSHTLVRAARAAVRPGETLLLLPLPPPDAHGAAMALRVVLAANYGVTDLIVDTAEFAALPALDGERVRKLAAAVGITFTAITPLHWDDDAANFVEPPAGRPATLSPDEVERLLLAGTPLPSWYAEPRVGAELAQAARPRSQGGFTVLFTGLSGSGKSTVARAFVARLLEQERRSVSLLDGDVVRTHLSKGLGFSRADRDLNVRRIGFVAAEITKAGGIAVCAPIAPYDATRRAVREMVEQHGGFVLVHVSTPLEVCEQRDRKGLYAQARAGRIPEFTGVSDPYETPADADVVVDTSRTDVADAVSLVLDRLAALGLTDRR